MMRVGMLWFDRETELPLAIRLERAASYYQQKYGRAANVCYLHPSTEGNVEGARVAGMILRLNAAVLPMHFWLGVEESEVAVEGAGMAAGLA